MLKPVTSAASAIAAYDSVAKGAPGSIGGSIGAPIGKGLGTGGGAGDGGAFADLVKSAIQEAARIGKTAEQASVAAVNDRADIGKVVTAVAEAELTLQTVITVRDRVIEAYREIMRMPI
jgi:flagellar hook-basal body complex protein FliE